MNWRIWLAFGFGLILGGCGMATVIGYLKLRADEVRKKAFARIPKIVIGYFVSPNDPNEKASGPVGPTARKEKRYGILN